jgi:hypothetical protein
MGELTTREADATFAELICADPQWLRAEFDALITAGFGAPPAWPRPPTRSPRHGATSRPPRPPAPRGTRTAASAHPRPTQPPRPPQRRAPSRPQRQAPTGGRAASTQNLTESPGKEQASNHRYLQHAAGPLVGPAAAAAAGIPGVLAQPQCSPGAREGHEAWRGCAQPDRGALRRPAALALSTLHAGAAGYLAARRPAARTANDRGNGRLMPELVTASLAAIGRCARPPPGSAPLESTARRRACRPGQPSARMAAGPGLNTSNSNARHSRRLARCSRSRGQR